MDCLVDEGEELGPGSDEHSPVDPLKIEED
jgi:hypothetical protein